ncbi:thioredoxin domain-containing protein [Patescibacteria group bacterium]
MRKYLLIGITIFTILGVMLFISNQQKNTTMEKPSVSNQKPTSPIKGQNMEHVDSSKYVDYSSTQFDTHNDKKRILFFHASWCPTCKAAEKDFLNNEKELPQGVIIFKTNYDTEDALKQKYNITYQHTFVQVDMNGNEITKWNGGGTMLLNESVE